MVEILEGIQDLFGLKEEGSIMVLALVAAGFFLSIGGSRTLVYQNSEEDLDKFSIVMLFLAAAAGTVACIPGFIMLITFKLKQIVTALLIAAAIDALLFFIVYTIIFRFRMAKYMLNPVTREVLAFAKQNNVVGIQCFVDGVRFYSVLENADYCKSESKTENRYNYVDFTADQSNPPRPTGFKAYMESSNSLGILRFADRGYPNLPDPAFFGKVLAKKLRGFDSAYHTVTLNFDQVSTNKIVHNICHVHRDSFVYKKSALAAIRVADNRYRRAAAAAAKKQEKQSKKWE